MSDQSLRSRIWQVLHQPLRFKTSKKEWALFLRQLAHLLAAGVLVDEGLDLLKRQKEFRNLKYYLPQVHERILAGASVGEAFEEIYKVDAFSLALIQVGEETGKLDQVVYQLSDYFLQEDRLEKKVKRALIYPSILMVSMVLIIFFMTSFVFPNFISFFDSYGATLNPMTLWMIRGFNGLYQVLPLFMGIGFVLFFLAKKSRNPKVRLWLDRLGWRLNPFGRLAKERLTQKLCHGLAIIINNGFPLLEGLSILRAGLTNAYLRQEMEELVAALEGGEDLSRAFEQSQLFTDLAVVLVGSGEKTGRLAQALIDIHKIYEVELEETIERNLAIFEPALILFLSVIVGFVVISMALPLFDIVNTFNF